MCFQHLNKPCTLSTGWLTTNSKFNNDIEVYLIKEYGENYNEIINKNIESVSKAKKIESSFEKNIDGKVEFPSYIGGLYIDKDDNLVVQLVEGKSTSLKSSVIDSINYDESIKTEYVSYSYEELKRSHDLINNILNYKNDTKNITVNIVDNEPICISDNCDGMESIYNKFHNNYVLKYLK